MKMANIIEQLDAEQMTREVPEFGPGDTVVVQVKVKEGQRERLQAFEGVVIAVKNRGLNSAFTVRKISYGEGVERVSRRTVLALLRFKSSAEAMCAVQNCITCVTFAVKQHVLKKKLRLKNSFTSKLLKPDWLVQSGICKIWFINFVDDQNLENNNPTRS